MRKQLEIWGLIATGIAVAGVLLNNGKDRMVLPGLDLLELDLDGPARTDEAVLAGDARRDLHRPGRRRMVDVDQLTTDNYLFERD